MYPGSSNFGQDDTQALRLKQIDSLRQYFSTVKEVVRDASFEIPLTLPSRKTIILKINLSRDFPRVPPTLQIAPAVTHKLVDANMFVTPNAHENLSRWNSNANLGKTVYEIVQKLMQDPPQILQFTTPAPMPVAAPAPAPAPAPATGPQSYPYATGGMGMSQSMSKPPPPYSQPSNSASGKTALPGIPSNFPELESKTPSELSQMLNDETEFNKFFESLPAVQTMKKLRDDLRTANEELAKRNLSREAEIEALKRELASRQQVVSDKRFAFEQKAQRQQEVMKQFSTPALIEQLSNAAQEAELSSDATANKFLAGEIELKDFVKEFMDKRKLFHLRAAKKESLMMLNRQ